MYSRVDAVIGAHVQPRLGHGVVSAVPGPVNASTDLAVVVRALDEVDVEVTELALTEPSLDDVYLTLAKNKTAA